MFSKMMNATPSSNKYSNNEFHYFFMIIKNVLSIVIDFDNDDDGYDHH